jgi:hypothetical protein
MYIYTIQFNNSKFFVADNTLSTFFKWVKKKDPLAIQTHPNGKLPTGARLIYFKSNLTPLEIKELAKNFELIYDNLSIDLYNFKKIETKLEKCLKILEILTNKKVVLQ